MKRSMALAGRASLLSAGSGALFVDLTNSGRLDLYVANDFGVNAFFENRRYDLSRVGRYKLNRKLGPEIERLQELFPQLAGQLDVHPVAMTSLSATVDGRHVTVTAAWTSGVDPSPSVRAGVASVIGRKRR